MAKLCARGKAAAKRKFKVYPSAYANMYASAVCSGKVTPDGKKRAKKAEGGKADEAPLRERADYGQRSRHKVSGRKRAIQKRSGYKKGGSVLAKLKKSDPDKKLRQEGKLPPLKKIAKGCGRVMSNRRKTTKYI